MSGTAGLPESAEMYRTVFDAMSEGVVMRMADGRLRMANESARRILGLPPDGHIPFDFPWHTIREDGTPLPINEHPLRIALTTGIAVRNVEMGIVRSDGSLVWASVSSEPLFHAGDSKPYAVVTTLVDVTQRKSTESQLRTLLNTIPDLVWLKDPEGIYLACNKEFELFFGATEAEIVGKTDHDFVDRELADFFRQKDREAMAAGKPTANEEWVTYANDGPRVLLETIKTPMRDAAGELIGVLGIARDITKARQDQEELRHTAQRLRESEQRWQIALEGADHGVWDWDLDKECVHCSPRLQVMLGLKDLESDATVDAASWKRWIHADDLGAVNDVVAAHMRGDIEQIHVRYRQRHADGHHLWVEVRGRVTARDENGRPTRISGTNTDITQALTAERALRDSQLMYKGLVDAIPMGIFRLDTDGRVLFVNPFMLRAFGLEHADQIVGKIIYDRVPAEDAVIARRDVEAVIATGKTQTRVREFFIRGVDQRRHLEVTRIPLIDAEGRIVGIQGMFRDITEQIHAEHALEHKVQERTRDLEATVRELEAFSYSISHDLRSPLRSIEGFMRIIEQKHAERLDESGKGYLARVRNNSRRMAELIDDLLWLSQVTRGEFDATDVDLSGLASNILAELRTGDPERNVDVQIAPGIRVHGDSRLLRIVMENLLGNAWKFTAKKADARISVSQVETPHGRAISIHDNGAGFDMRYADKMFRPFQRLHSSMEFSGTGIGLAIVQRIIARHDGRVWAEGVIGFGATVYFTLQTHNKSGDE